MTTRRYARKNCPEVQVHTTACPHLTGSNQCKTVPWALAMCPHFVIHRCPHFQVAARIKIPIAFDRFKSVQNSTLGARDVSAFRNSQVSAFPSGRAHQNTHKIEGTVICCPHFRGVCFSQVSARTDSTVFVCMSVYSSAVYRNYS